MVSGTMTSRRYHIPLLFFVLHVTVHLSEAGCHDYFQVETWKEHLTRAVDLVATKDPKDVMPCSVKKQCGLGIDFMCAILSDCYEQDPDQKNDKCQGDTLRTLPFYLFMCRTARDLKHVPKGCEHENECELTTASTISDHSTAPPSTQLPTTTQTTTTQTTTPPPPSTPSTPSTTQTTATPSTTTQTTAPPSTTPTQTTAPPSTTPTTTPSTTTPTTPLSRSTIRLLQPTTTTAATTTATTTTTTTAAAAATALLTSRTAAADTQGNVSFSDGQRGSNITNTEWTITLIGILAALVVSLFANGMLGFCLWRTNKRLNRQNMDIIYNCDAAVEDQPHLESNTHTSVSPGGQLETTFLMQTLESGTHPEESN